MVFAIVRENCNDFSLKLGNTAIDYEQYNMTYLHGCYACDGEKCSCGRC